MGEEWRSLKGIVEFGDNYAVSSYGSIMNTLRNRPLKPRNKRGYHQAVFCLNGNRRDYIVHRLVAIAFIPTNDISLQINHIDGNKGNNSAENLEWVTPSENTRHAYETGLRTPEKHAKLMKTVHSKPVIQYDLSGNILGEFGSAVEAEGETGVRANTVSAQCRFKHMPKTKDFYFRFAN